MLDTYGRKLVQPMMTWIARQLLARKVTAIQITYLAFGIGVMTGPLIAMDFPILAIMALWLSGLLDVVDGSMAREAKTASPWGCLLDITFDQVVELSVIVGLAIRYPGAPVALLLLTAVLLVSMTVFLTVGALVKAAGFKAFYYQPGLVERTEELLFLTLMIVLSDWLIWATLTFTFLKLITTLMRIKHARRLFVEQPR